MYDKVNSCEWIYNKHITVVPVNHSVSEMTNSKFKVILALMIIFSFSKRENGSEVLYRLVSELKSADDANAKQHLLIF